MQNALTCPVDYYAYASRELLNKRGRLDETLMSTAAKQQTSWPRRADQVFGVRGGGATATNLLRAAPAKRARVAGENLYKNAFFEYNNDLFAPFPPTRSMAGGFVHACVCVFVCVRSWGRAKDDLSWCVVALCFAPGARYDGPGRQTADEMKFVCMSHWMNELQSCSAPAPVNDGAAASTTRKRRHRRRRRHNQQIKTPQFRPSAMQSQQLHRSPPAGRPAVAHRTSGSLNQTNWPPSLNHAADATRKSSSACSPSYSSVHFAPRSALKLNWFLLLACTIGRRIQHNLVEPLSWRLRMARFWAVRSPVNRNIPRG
jgi:hypothetical protein